VSVQIRPIRDASGTKLAQALRELTARVPGVWTVGQLRTCLIDDGVLTEKDPNERLAFALSCLVAGGEAEKLGFDSFRIYPHASD
jgi:hypothetical protein